MSQLISRPAVYLVIGIGVLALLVSQFRSTDNRIRTSASELDPFSSLENLSGRNLAKFTQDWSADAIPNKIAQVEAVPQMVREMVRDELTAVDSYQQTASTMLNIGTTEVQPVEESTAVETFDAPIQLADIDEIEAQVPAANQIEAVDENLTVLELDEPIAIDSEMSGERYQLEDIAEEMVEATTPKIDPEALMEEPQAEEQPVSVFESTKARNLKENNLRPKGWRKNPFIKESNDVVETKPANEALEIETSSIELPGLDDSDSFSANTVISTEMNDADQISTVGNFEPESAPSIVSSIPTTEGSFPVTEQAFPIVDQPMQSVMSAGQQFTQPTHYNESLPIVVGLPDSVAHKAVHNIEYGKSLSRRGAAFAARQEFYSSLRILAQAHDTQAGGTAYTRALRDAIIALKEAEDFIVSDTETQIGLNVGAVVEGHSTKLIPLPEAANMTAIGAMQRYFTFASNQLRVASGQNPVAAEALYCLGKLHTVQAKFGANTSKLDIAKSIVFHQAAISSDRSNFRSANELGVLMANSGRLQESQEMLKRSLQIQQLPQAWQNLAVVHQRAGQAQLAQLAHQEYLLSSRQQETALNQNTIRWVNTQTFNQGTPLELRQGATKATQALQQGQQNTGKPTISERLKSLF